MSIRRSGVLTLEGFVKTFDQSFITEGLSHEAERAGSLCAKRDLFRGKRAHENDRLAVAIGNQAILKIDPVHAGHLQVGDHASGIPNAVGSKILFGGSERRRVIAERSYKA